MDRLAPGGIDPSTPLITVTDAESIPAAIRNLPAYLLKIYTPEGDLVWIDGEGGLITAPWRWGHQGASYYEYRRRYGAGAPGDAWRWGISRATEATT